MNRNLLVFLFFISLPLYGQVDIASLKKNWENTDLPDSIRINSINKLAWEGFLFTNPDSSFYYAQIHYDFAKKKGLIKEMAVARNTQGTAFYMSGNYARAIDYFYQSLGIKEDIKDYKGIAATLNNIGMIYDEQENQEKAVEHYTKAIEYFQKVAIKKEQDSQIIVASYHNLGVLYLNAKKYDKALEYFNKALALTDETKFLRERAYSFSNLGQLYLEQNDLEKSKKYFEEALELAKEIEDENGIINALNHISFLFNQQAKYHQAIAYASEAMDMAQKNRITSEIKNAAKSLYLSHKQLGNYETALSMYEVHINARDSIMNEENKEEVLRQEFKYAYERQATADSIAFAAAQEIQNLKIAEQQIQLKSEKTQKLLLSSVLALLILLSFVGYRSYKKTSKANYIIAQQKQEVEKQRDKIARQHALLEEKSRKIVEFNNTLETLVEQRTGELESSLIQIRNYQFDLAHKIRAPYVSLVGLLNLVRDERFDSSDNQRVLRELGTTAKSIEVVLKNISQELNKFDAEEK